MLFSLLPVHATPCFYFILFSLVASLKHKKDNDDDDDVSINSNLKTLPCFLSVFLFCFVLFERSIGE